MKISFFVIIVVLVNLGQYESAAPAVYYSNVGDTATMQCTSGGGSYACFSTYTFQTLTYPMAFVNTSRKYTVNAGSITVNNVQATDAGFYACSNDCSQMRVDQISYYLQPMSNGQPIDPGKAWLAIPPFTNINNPNKESYYIVVSDERTYADKGSGLLTTGEIIGLVIGLVAAFLITIAVILILICLWRRKKQKREKSVDYSTIERDYNNADGKNSMKQIIKDKDGERNSLANNKKDMSNNAGNLITDIRTKDLRGPNVLKPNEINNVGQAKEFPNLSFDQEIINDSQRIPIDKSHQESYNAGNNQLDLNRAYQNQIDANFENQQIPRPGRRESDGHSNNSKTSSTRENNGILPPPPSRPPVNKIQFPSRNNQQQQPQPQIPQRTENNENIHLQQILKETGFYDS